MGTNGYLELRVCQSCVHSAETGDGIRPLSAQIREFYMIKGSHCTDEQKAKMRLAKLGKKLSPSHIANRTIAQTGLKRSSETRAKMSIAQRGENNPQFGKTLTTETRIKMSLAKIGKKKSDKTRAAMSKAQKGHPVSDAQRKHHAEIMRGRKASMETRIKMSDARRGDKCYLWKGGISFEPYCPKFNNDLKRRIRTFFEYRCIVCGKSTEENKRELSCHHVEYNKQACCDGKPIHFATMCTRCHSRTNHHRAQWEDIMHRIIDEIYNGRSYYTKEEFAALKDGSI